MNSSSLGAFFFLHCWLYFVCPYLVTSNGSQPHKKILSRIIEANTKDPTPFGLSNSNLVLVNWMWRGDCSNSRMSNKFKKKKQNTHSTQKKTFTHIAPALFTFCCLFYFISIHIPGKRSLWLSFNFRWNFSVVKIIPICQHDVKRQINAIAEKYQCDHLFAWIVSGIKVRSLSMEALNYINTGSLHLSHAHIHMHSWANEHTVCCQDNNTNCRLS